MGNQPDANEYGYNSYTQAQTVVGDANLNNRHFYVTGANTGIGFETARVLFNAGATITMACRNNQKMVEAKEKIENQEKVVKTDGGSIRIHNLDLSSLAKVRECVENYRREFEDAKIDTLILNAGVMDVKKGRSEDGFEIHMSINHFGHALLTFLLLPLMNDKEGNRIVILSSKAHRFGTISFDDMDFRKRDYSGFKAYGQSKLANIAFCQELDKRLKEKEKKIEAMCLHPGVIKTELGRDSFRVKLFYTVGQAFCKSIAQGAATTVFCALDQRLKGLGGNYFADCGRRTVKAGLLSNAINKRFFEVTEERIQQKFPFDVEKEDELQQQVEEVEGEEEEEEEEEEVQPSPQREEEPEQIISIEEVKDEEKSSEESEEEEEESHNVDERVVEDDDEEEEDDDGELDDVVDESMGRRKKKEEESEEEEDDLDDIVDEAASPRKKGEEEDEDEED